MSSKIVKPTPPKTRKKRVRSWSTIAFLNEASFNRGACIKAWTSTNLSDRDAYRIDIQDCSREITLHGQLNTPKDRKNCLFKINTLIKVLEDMKAHLVTEFN